MEETKVTNNVNLNLNQSDLVEVMIEDFKEEIEAKIKVLEDKDKALKIKFEEMLEKQKTEAIKQLSSTTVDAGRKFMTSIGLEFKETSHINYVSVGEPVFFDRVDTQRIQNYKVVTAGAIENCTYKKNDSVVRNIPSSGSISIATEGSQKAGMSVWSDKLSIKQTAIIKKLTEDMFKIQCEQKEIGITRGLLIIDLYRLETGEKRFKAKFIKSALGKSKAGVDMLTMMETVRKSTKLLG